MIDTKTERWAMGRALTMDLLVATALMAACLLFTARPAHAATFTVNSTKDEHDLDFPGGVFDGSSDGKCSVPTAGDAEVCTLRAAIQHASVTKGADTIEFDIPGTGPHTISPATDLPTITKPLTIDGYTQGDATADTADDATENDGHRS